MVIHILFTIFFKYLSTIYVRIYRLEFMIKRVICNNHKIVLKEFLDIPITRQEK